LNEEVSTLRYLYKDVINGYSKVEEKNVFIKHLKETDIGKITERRFTLKNEAKSKGLLDEEQKVELLISQDLWSQVKEDDLEKLKKEVLHLRESKKKLILGRQIKQFNKRIERQEKLHSDLYKERKEQIGFVAEEYADKKINEEVVRHTFFKNHELKEQYFSDEEFEDLTSTDLDAYTVLHTAVNSQFSDNILKKISVCPFFVNSFFICDNNPNLFFGKPVVELTNYQIDIFSYAKYYKFIMSECKPPPQELYEKPQKLVEYYEATRKAKEAKESKKGLGSGKQSEYMGSTMFGATKEELASMAAGDEEGSAMVDFSKEAEKTGGDMGINEFLKLHQK
jgi:hypothetical protein